MPLTTLERRALSEALTAAKAIRPYSILREAEQALISKLKLLAPEMSQAAIIDLAASVNSCSHQSIEAFYKQQQTVLGWIEAVLKD